MNVYMRAGCLNNSYFFRSYVCNYFHIFSMIILPVVNPARFAGTHFSEMCIPHSAGTGQKRPGI